MDLVDVSIVSKSRVDVDMNNVTVMICCPWTTWKELSVDVEESLLTNELMLRCKAHFDTRHATICLVLLLTWRDL
jgi:hypothetical protein